MSKARRAKRETEAVNNKIRGMIKLFIQFREKHISVVDGNVIQEPIVDQYFENLNRSWGLFERAWKKQPHSVQVDRYAFKKFISDFTLSEARMVWLAYAENRLLQVHKVTKYDHSELEQLFGTTGMDAKEAADLIAAKSKPKKRTYRKKQILKPESNQIRKMLKESNGMA